MLRPPRSNLSSVLQAPAGRGSREAAMLAENDQDVSRDRSFNDILEGAKAGGGRLRSIKIGDDGALTFTFKKTTGRGGGSPRWPGGCKTIADQAYGSVSDSLPHSDDEDEDEYWLQGKVSNSEVFSRRTDTSSVKTFWPTKQMRDKIILVVYGANSQLAKSRIFPALMRANDGGLLPANLLVVAYGRLSQSTGDFVNAVVSKAAPEKGRTISKSSKFWSRVKYVQGGFLKPESAWQLSNLLRALDEDQGISHCLFYLAVVASFYEPALSIINEALSPPDALTTVIFERFHWSPTMRNMSALPHINLVHRGLQPMPSHWATAFANLRAGNSLIGNAWNGDCIQKVLIAIYCSPGDAITVDEVIRSGCLHVLYLVVAENPSVALPCQRMRVLRSVKAKEEAENWDTRSKLIFTVSQGSWQNVPFVVEKAGQSRGEEQIVEMTICVGPKSHERCGCNEIRLSLTPSRVTGDLILKGVRGEAHKVDLDFLLGAALSDKHRSEETKASVEFICGAVNQTMSMVNEEEAQCLLRIFSPLMQPAKRRRPKSFGGTATGSDWSRY